jgi:hypothetical protein
MNNKKAGDVGEQEVVDLVPCPNCGKPLMKLPPNYPLVDIQCTGCTFRAQVKTNRSKPKSIVFGAGWDIVEKTLKWRQLPSTARRANYKMFNYTQLDKLPYFVVYQKGV